MKKFIKKSMIALTILVAVQSCSKEKNSYLPVWPNQPKADFYPVKGQKNLFKSIDTPYLSSKGIDTPYVYRSLDTPYVFKSIDTPYFGLKIDTPYIAILKIDTPYRKPLVIQRNNAPVVE